MTAIATFSIAGSTFLVADTLVFDATPGVTTKHTSWLSTGVRVDPGRPRISEGPLKIWLLQNNLAVGHAGDLAQGTALLSLVSDRISYKPFQTVAEFLDFIKWTGLRSVGPLRGTVALCGFMLEPTTQVKFKCSLTLDEGFSAYHTADQDTYYAIGSAAAALADVIDHIRPPPEGTADPRMLLSIVEDQLYKRQFVAPQNLIFSDFAGGAITGVYANDDLILWSDGRTVIPFVNTGDTGLDAEFRWLPIAYKTWLNNGCLFSSAVFEQDGAWYQRLTQYTNKISGREVINEDNLPSQARTMNSSVICVMLLPDPEGQYPSVIRMQGGTLPFDEEMSGGRLAGIRLNSVFFDRISDMFFVLPDRTIVLFKEAYQAKAAWVTEQLARCKDQPPSKVLTLLQTRAVALAKLGFEDGDKTLLCDSLITWLDAWRLCADQKPESLPDAVHNVKQFLQDLHDRCRPDDLKAIQAMAHRQLRTFWEAGT